MAKIAGRQSNFQIKDSGGTLRDLSASITNVDFPREVAVLETTGLGETDRKFIVGLKGATISISGNWDAATNNVDSVLDGILAVADRDFQYGPEGTASGKVKYTGTAIESRYTAGSPVDGVVSFSADFTINGAVTRGTFA